MAFESSIDYWRPLLDTIARAEAIAPDSEESYDTVYGGVKPGLSQMTIGDVDRWQVGHAQKTGSSASGRYQFMNVLDQAKAVGLSADDPFSQENQDRMAIGLITGKRGVTPELIRSNPEKAMELLSMEWAGLPKPDGTSYYAGDGRNAATVSADAVRDAFARLGSGGGAPLVAANPSSGSGAGGAGRADPSVVDDWMPTSKGRKRRSIGSPPSVGSSLVGVTGPSRKAGSVRFANPFTKMQEILAAMESLPSLEDV